ncbi:MAG: hypothetical protein ACERKD_14680 [Prolixibacteraceae bacterium]
MQIDWGLDKQGRIISMHYSGVITIKDLKGSWLEVLDQEIIASNIRGFILDCRNTVMEIDVEQISLLSDFFKNNLASFKMKRFAYITRSPNQIILPLLLQEDNYFYESKPFSTFEAAIDWVLN